MTITKRAEALDKLALIRECQARANKSLSPLTKAAEAEKAVTHAVDIIEFLITSGDAKENPSCQIQP